MKEMRYKRERELKPVVLDSGKIDGTKYAIISLGTHPCAYVENVLDAKSCYDNQLAGIQVHGGFTYLDKAYWNESDAAEYLGWDYAHCDDYIGYFDDNNACNDYCYQTSAYALQGLLKKWTTSQIFEEVKEVINQMNIIKNLMHNCRKNCPVAKNYDLKHPQLFTLSQAKQIKIGGHFYFGVYNDYPIEWIKVADNRAFAACILDNMAFGDTKDYKTSNIRKWCNELCCICGIELDAIYIPSFQKEISEWFKTVEERRCGYSDECKNRGIDDGYPYYWTTDKSPALYWYSSVGYVQASGAFHYTYTYDSSIGARPALKLM